MIGLSVIFCHAIDHLARHHRRGLGVDDHHAIVADNHPGIGIAFGGEGVSRTDRIEGDGLVGEIRAGGDPNSGVIVGDDGVMVVDAQATPVMARQVIDRVAKITDKPIKYVLLTHYHAVRVLGASAYVGAEILASDTTRGADRRTRQTGHGSGSRPMHVSDCVESIPGLTWPSITFPDQMSVWLGRREVRIMRIGRGHTAGDVVALSARRQRGVFRRPRRVSIGVLLRRRAFHRLAGYARSAGRVFSPRRWCRAAARRSRRRARSPTASRSPRDLPDHALWFGGGKASPRATRSRNPMTRRARPWIPRFANFAIYEHCMPFNVSRAYDEASGIDRPVIWTAERDRAMWAALRGLARPGVGWRGAVRSSRLRH